MKKNQYKIGIIGAGIIAEFSHLPVLKTLDNVNVEWVFDKNTERSKLVSNMYQTMLLPEEKLEQGINDVDICLLTIPLGVRFPYIQSCSEKGKAVYAEKPFAISLADHKKYCSFFLPHKLAIGFQRRYYKIVSVLRSIINTNIFGNLAEINISQGYFMVKGDKKYLTNAALSGGGVIVESAIHLLDQILVITSAKSVNVTSVKTLQQNGIDYDSTFASTLTAETGDVKVNAEISTLRNLKNTIEFNFDTATLECNLSHNSNVVIKSKYGNNLNFSIDKYLNNHSEHLTSTSISGSFNIFWNQFLNALDTETPNSTSGINSLLTTSWIESIYNHINKS